MLRIKGKKRIGAFLGEGTAFKGQLNFEGTVRLDGKLEGEIITKDTLVLGETAQIKADISVGYLIVKGKVFGDITATKKMEVHTGAEIYGNIKTHLLKIEEGAIFVGKCEMLKEGGKHMRVRSSAVPKPKKEEEGKRQLVLYPPKIKNRLL